MSYNHTNRTSEVLRDGTKVTTTTSESRTVGRTTGTFTPRIHSNRATITPTRFNPSLAIPRTVKEQRVSSSSGRVISGHVSGHVSAVHSGAYTGPILDGGKQTVPLNQRIA